VIAPSIGRVGGSRTCLAIANSVLITAPEAAL
jgi:hypothetical protein